MQTAGSFPVEERRIRVYNMEDPGAAIYSLGADGGDEASKEYCLILCQHGRRRLQLALTQIEWLKKIWQLLYAKVMEQFILVIILRDCPVRGSGVDCTETCGKTLALKDSSSYLGKQRYQRNRTTGTAILDPKGENPKSSAWLLMISPHFLLFATMKFSLLNTKCW